VYPDHDPLTEGAGFLNVKGAVELSQFLGVPSNGSYPSTSNWSARLIWGNQLLSGGRLTASANAWLADVTWGTAVTPNGQNVEWGVLCSTPTCDETTDNVWRATCSNAACSDVTWGGGSSGNVVWGSACGGADCQQQWSPGIGAGIGSVVWGTFDEGDTVVWGTADEGDTVVWGTSDAETAVWGVACSDPACEPVVWGPE
jgi:hypothetical protein